MTQPLFEVDQRCSTGKFGGDAEGDHHATFFEVPEVTGSVQDFIDRISGKIGGKFLIPLIRAIDGISIEQPAVTFLEDHGDAINNELRKQSIGGHSIRIALMDGVEQ